MAGSPVPTTPTAEIEEDPLLLYEPIHHQVSAKKIPWTTEYLMVTAKQAQKWLDDADEYEKFGQRPRTQARIKRWLNLMRSSRFVDFLPNGPLCFNEDGVLMNGGNRLAAVALHDRPVGFIVCRGVPTWMMSYFDNGNVRSLRESMFIHKRNTDPATAATIRLGLRYEEFLFGKRKETGWTEWGRHKDEHVDIDNFYQRREYVLDFVSRGKQVHKRTGLQASSATCFIAYQQLAWTGTDSELKLGLFLDGLSDGVMLDKGNPALTLRNWGQNDGYIGGYTYGRREGHLLLLFKFFTAFCEDVKVFDVKVAKGFPMSMPYHPDGWDVGCQNAREALLKMDREA